MSPYGCDCIDCQIADGRSPMQRTIRAEECCPYCGAPPGHDCTQECRELFGPAERRERLCEEES